MEYILRPYQERAVQDGIELLQSKTKAKGFIVIGTGGGKSLVIAEIAKRVGGKVLVLQPSKELLAQNYEKYKTYADNAAIYSASLKSKEIGYVTFATIGSIKNLAKEFKDLGFKYVCIDEAHFSCKPGSMVDKFLKAAGITNVLGLTATPVIMKTYMGVTMWKMLNRTRESIFSKLVHVTQISHLVENGFWAEIVYEVVSIDPTKYKLNTVGSDYTFESMRLGYSENAVEDKIIQTLYRLENEGHKSILIFVPTIDEAKALSEKVRGCEYVSSQCKAAKRKKVVEGFKDGSIPYVVNCQILGTGFDFPELSAAILARPTMSLAVYYQQVGRICRPHPNKKYAKVVDISGNVPRLGRVEEIEFKEDRIYGWQMYCGGIQMTNVPLPEIGSEKLAPVVEIHYSAEKDLVFDFGRFKGKHLRTIPNWYLDWMLKSYNFKSRVGFRKSIREEVQRREKYQIDIR